MSKNQDDFGTDAASDRIYDALETSIHPNDYRTAVPRILRLLGNTGGQLMLLRDISDQFENNGVVSLRPSQEMLIDATYERWGLRRLVDGEELGDRPIAAFGIGRRVSPLSREQDPSYYEGSVWVERIPGETLDIESVVRLRLIRLLELTEDIRLLLPEGDLSPDRFAATVIRGHSMDADIIRDAREAGCSESAILAFMSSFGVCRDDPFDPYIDGWEYGSTDLESVLSRYSRLGDYSSRFNALYRALSTNERYTRPFRSINEELSIRDGISYS